MKEEIRTNDILKFGNVKVIINTCQSCEGSPSAYFVQIGDEIQRQNCKSTFAIDNLDNVVENGCNPMLIKDGIITIGTKQLNNLKDKFANWEGLKV